MYAQIWILVLFLLEYTVAGHNGIGEQGWQIYPNIQATEGSHQVLYEKVAPAPAPAPYYPKPAPAPSFHFGPNPYELPRIQSATTQDLIELYRAQTSRASKSPPVLLSGSESTRLVDSTLYTIDDEDYPPAGYVYQTVPVTLSRRRRYIRNEPRSPLRYPASMVLKGELTAHKADYTEPYTVWYDTNLGSSRVDFHKGATSSYRIVTPNGEVQRVLKRVARATGSERRKCTVGTPQPNQPQDTASSVLPDPGGFSFGGFNPLSGGRRGRRMAEVWKRTRRETVAGEELTHRHELTVLRRHDDTVIPIKYSVTTDSSVLGAGSDHYEHHYREARAAAPVPAGLFDVNLDSDCDEVQTANSSQSISQSVLNPIGGFVSPLRDALFPEFFDKFTKDFGRQYVDKAEEVLRMNVLGQTYRWLEAFNRVGKTFEVGVNFLADRLESELDALRGIASPGEGLPAESFPHADAETQRLAKDLPEAFDWRDKGAVTPPRYQGECASCWAFAVTAAVEGALHAATGKLTPLAEQALVDCGNKTGTHGCKGTWPSFAYDYVQETGLPAKDQYTPYAEKVLQCKDDSVPAVTRISAHVNVTSNSVDALKVAIGKHSPVLVIIDSTPKSFIFYKKGVLDDENCGKKLSQLNHAVTAVGWGTMDGKPHFIAKNSWSDKWGEEGYVRLEGKSNTCGVLTLPSYPRLEPTDAQPKKD